jgi:hypothetical protein
MLYAQLVSSVRVVKPSRCPGASMQDKRIYFVRPDISILYASFVLSRQDSRGAAVANKPVITTIW